MRTTVSKVFLAMMITIPANFSNVFLSMIRDTNYKSILGQDIYSVPTTLSKEY